MIWHSLAGKSSLKSDQGTMKTSYYQGNKLKNVLPSNGRIWEKLATNEPQSILITCVLFPQTMTAEAEEMSMLSIHHYNKSVFLRNLRDNKCSYVRILIVLLHVQELIALLKNC